MSRAATILLLALASTAWAGLDATKLRLDPSDAVVSVLARYSKLESRTLTGPYGAGW